jgi:glycosyltransferase involved in cell wall biosynthesis
LGLGDRVSFTYVPDPSRVGDLVRDARWLVLPSYHEGYPLALLEAFARGRPVIATSVGAVPEMCGQSQAAVLVPPRDETALRQTMTSALEEDAAAYARRCEHARDLFQRLSGPEAVRANMRAALEQLASRPCSRHGERDR